jgi:hypothetical protein
MALLMLVLHLGACMTWKPTPYPPRALNTIERPESIRLTDPTGNRRVVDELELRNDTIFGLGEEERRCSPGFGGCVEIRPTVQIAMDRVLFVETRRLSMPRTTLALAATGVFVKIMYEILAPPPKQRPRPPLCISC